MFKKIYTSILQFFANHKASKEINIALNLVVKVLPLIKIAADLARADAPTSIVSTELQQLQYRFPRLFDGSILTTDELKSYLLGVATALLMNRTPKLSQTTATLAVQLAFLQLKAEGQSPQFAPIKSDNLILKVTPPKKSFLEL